MKLPLPAVLAFAVALNAQAADTNILGRAYLVQPAIWQVLCTTSHDAASTGTLEGELRHFFESMEVSFPEGSSIRRQGNLLIIWNTPENLERFHKIWNADGLPSNQIEIDCSLVALPQEDLDTSARKSGRATATAEDVRALWRGGAGRLVSTSKALTRSGVEAQVKGVAEYRFLTDYEVQRDRAAVSNQTDVASDEALAHFGTEHREAGTILTVTPTIGPDGRTIDLTLLPDLVEMTGWDEYATAKLGNSDGGKALVRQVRQPRFHSRNLTTSVVLWDGGTVVLGGFRGEGGEETVYAFISARLVNPAGRPANAAPASGSGP